MAMKTRSKYNTPIKANAKDSFSALDKILGVKKGNSKKAADDLLKKMHKTDPAAIKVERVKNK